MALAQIVTSTGEVSPVIPSTGGAVSGQIIVGDTSIGSLSAADAAVISTDSDAIFGSQAGSEGHGSLTGVGTAMTTDGGLYVGSFGLGTFNLSDSATFTSNGIGSIGEQIGSEGSVSVADAGSSLNITNELYIGRAGNGTMAVGQGGAATVGGLISIGDQAGSEGAIELSGTGSTLNGGNDLFVGQAGTGSLSIAGGAVGTINGSIFIANDAGSNGTVTIAEQGSALNTNGNLSVGNNGTGALHVSNEASVSAGGNITVGEQVGSQGSLTVDGPGTTLSANELYVGYAGAGSLSLTDGATATAGHTTFGDQAGSQATATLTGQGTSLSADYLGVGQGGAATMEIRDGATVSSANEVSIGNDAGASGSVTLAGQGSALAAGLSLSVGWSGTGSLNMSDGATASAASSVRIGRSVGADGTVTLIGPGTTLTASDDIAVAESGTGRLEMSDGAIVSAGDIFAVASGAGSNGTVNLSGTGTTVSSTGNMGIGLGGNGTLNASDGALVSTNQTLFVGLAAGSNGVINLSGSGTGMALGTALIGYAGNGALNMSDGATATVSSTITVGDQGGSQGNVVLSDAGTSLSAGSTLSVGGSGNGTLEVRDGATVNAAGDFIVGQGVGSQGTVLLSGQQSLLSASDIEIGQQGSGTLSLTDAATLRSTGSLVLAAQSGSQGTLVIGGNTGSPPAAAGDIDVASIDFGLGTGLLAFNHSSDSYRLTSAITGNGTIDQRAGTTYLAGDGSAFGGLTSVSGGTLYVERSLGGTLDVGSDGTLAGAGTVGTLTVASQGTVSPGYGTGASYETLTVAGNYHAQAGSLYVAQVNLAPAQSDQIVVRGTATIDPGSRLGVQFAPASAANQYALGTRYVLLTADQGLTGTYTVSGGALKLSALLNLQPGYDAQNAYLEIVQSRSLTSVGQTPNQTATLTAVDNTSQNNPLKSSLSNLPTEEALLRVADSLSGEIHASSKILMLDHSRFLREATTNRLRQVDSERESAEALRRSGDEWVGWGQVLHSSGHMDGDSNAADLDDNYNGFLVGADRSIGDQWRLGVVAGAAHTNLSSSLSSKSEGDDYTLGVYAGTSLGPWRVTGGAAYSYQKLSVKRETEILGSRATSSSHPKAHLAQVFTEVGYPFTFSASTIEPFAQLAYVRLWTQDFKEQGGAAPLDVGSSKEGTTLTTLGSHATSQWLWNGKKISVHGTLGWRHAEGYVESDRTMSFTDSSDFTVVGVSLPRNAVVVEAGLKLQARNDLTFDIAYNGLSGDGSRQNTIKGSVVWEF